MLYNLIIDDIMAALLQTWKQEKTKDVFRCVKMKDLVAAENLRWHLKCYPNNVLVVITWLWLHGHTNEQVVIGSW